MLKIDGDTLKQRVQTVERDLRASGIEALVLYATGSVLGSKDAASQTPAATKWCICRGPLARILIACTSAYPLVELTIVEATSGNLAEAVIK